MFTGMDWKHATADTIAVDTSTRPHMRQRPDETVQQYHQRLSRSCYRCGQQYTDLAELARHEDAH